MRRFVPFAVAAVTLALTVLGADVTWWP